VLDDRLADLIERAGPPVTARQTYYMACAAGLVPKTNPGYRKVIRRLSAMRDDGRLPWSWIADNTRWVRQAEVYGGILEAVEEWQAQYRRDYWADQSTRVELWVESDSIASFLGKVADEYGVPMFVCRGQASRSYIHGAAQTAQAIGKPVEVLYLGDWDPTGLQIDVSMAERYARYGARDLTVERIGVTPEQITAYGLSGGEPKRGDPNYGRFVERCATAGVAVEAIETEALPPNALRAIVRHELVARIDWERWSLTERVEQAERSLLGRLVEGVTS
jgi:hypothetical protein